MKTEIMCTSCKVPHLDHYECDKCHNHLHGGTDTCGGCFDRKSSWAYCPYCGTPLYSATGAQEKTVSVSAYRRIRRKWKKG